MVVDSFSKLFERDMLRIIDELNQYTDEKLIWKKAGSISNSAGNLTLHLIGNLNHFIGYAIGNTGYIRNRDLEFSTTFSSRDELISSLNRTISTVKLSLSKLKDDDLYTTFPLLKHDETVTFEHMLLHLFAHLSYHLGQINYHRRLLEA